MGRSKDLFMKMMQELFGDMDSSFKELSFSTEKAMHEKNSLESETFEVEKNGVKSIITVWFDKRGYIVGQSYESTYNPTDQEAIENRIKVLEEKKTSALEQEDYAEAAKIRDELKHLKNQQSKTN